MFRQRFGRVFGGMGLTAMCLANPGLANEGPRSLVHLTAVKGYYSYSIPWDLAKPEAPVPLHLPHIRSGMAIFLGHVKNTGAAGNDVVGGDLLVRLGRTDRTFKDIWKDRLVEVGTVKMPRKGTEEIYFVSMEGDLFQTWHFNLFNPMTSTLVTLSYSWGHDDQSAVAKKSDNFETPELSDERELLDGLAREPFYRVPFNKK